MQGDGAQDRGCGFKSKVAGGGVKFEGMVEVMSCANGYRVKGTGVGKYGVADLVAA